MFVFGHGHNGKFNLVKDGSHVYTFPTEELARECFHCVSPHSHLYQVDTDLSTAHLIKVGDNALSAPEEVKLVEEQKLALWSSYVYKSLLSWAPYPDEV